MLSALSVGWPPEDAATLFWALEEIVIVMILLLGEESPTAAFARVGLEGLASTASEIRRAAIWPALEMDALIPGPFFYERHSTRSF
jgi:hypothetical protein